MQTKETVYTAGGPMPGRNNGTRLTSVTSAGFTFSKGTSADKTLAPAGNATFKKGCAWFLIRSFTSVSDFPSDVTSVVITAFSATAPRTLLSGKRTHSKASAGASYGCR